MKTIEKALDILEILLNHGGEVSTPDLSRLSGLNNNSLYRVTSTLRKRGYLKQKKDRGRYALGPKFLAYSSLVKNKVKVEDIVSHPDYWNTTDTLFNDTAANMREFCKDAYQDRGTEYILIGGDNDGANRIERREMDYEDEYNSLWTYYFLEDAWQQHYDGDTGYSLEVIFDYAHDHYPDNTPGIPHWPDDEPQEFDGNSGSSFYI